MNIDKEMKSKTDALRKEAMRIRDDAIDHEYDIARDFAASIAHYLSTAQLSKALVACREAVVFGGHFDDDFDDLAASIVIEDGEPSRSEKHTVLRRCHWCGRIISDRQLTVVSDVEFVFVCTDCLDWKRGDGDIIVTWLNAKLETAEPETPIYETLAPGECLIISKDGDSLLVACNNDGELIVDRVQLEDGIDE